MADKTWLLNAAAIRAARACIKTLHEEFGVHIKLSDPDFLSLLSEYSKLTDSPKMKSVVAELATYASGGLKKSSPSRVAPRPSGASEPEQSNHQFNGDRRDESVRYYGKEYHRWHNGKEFKGLYRGQPHYV